MRMYSTIFLIFIILSSLHAQNIDYNRKDYQWLQEPESEDNLKWVEARNNESLDYLNAIEILPDLELNGTGGGRGTGALGERGDPEVPEEWAYMKKISPLHALQANKDYPPILQLTSRNDDISDSAKTRRFHQRLKDLGYTNVYLIETAGGGHS